MAKPRDYKAEYWRRKARELAAARKTVAKTAKRTKKKGVRGVPFRKGDPRSGVGKKGRSGRKPDALRTIARELFDDYDLLGIAATIALEGERDSDALAAIRFIKECGWGRTAEPDEGDDDSADDRRRRYDSARKLILGRLALYQERA